MKELSLRPYNGRLFVCIDANEHAKIHLRTYGKPDEKNASRVGRFTGGEGRDGKWTYVVWGKKPCYLVHELTHVALHTFERCGIDPICGNGEPFCYLLSQLVLEAM